MCSSCYTPASGVLLVRHAQQPAHLVVDLGHAVQRQLVRGLGYPVAAVVYAFISIATAGAVRAVTPGS
jgi:hypothetical protein